MHRAYPYILIVFLCIFFLGFSMAFCEENTYTIPNGTLEVGDDYFYGEQGIRALRIPASLTHFSYVSNWQLPDLDTYFVDDSSIHFTSKDGVLFSKDMAILIAYPMNKTDVQYVVPADVKFISQYAFSHNPYLEEVNIGKNVQTIGDYAFYRCKMLKQVEFGENLRCIGTSAFENTLIKSIHLPDSLVYIGGSAFQRTSLSEVIIPKSVVAIDGGAFCECYSLKTITIPGTVQYIDLPLFGWNNMRSDDKITVYSEINSYMYSIYSNTNNENTNFVWTEIE